MFKKTEEKSSYDDSQMKKRSNNLWYWKKNNKQTDTIFEKTLKTLPTYSIIITKKYDNVSDMHTTDSNFTLPAFLQQFKGTRKCRNIIFHAVQGFW